MFSDLPHTPQYFLVSYQEESTLGVGHTGQEFLSPISRECYWFPIYGRRLQFPFKSSPIV